MRLANPWWFPYIDAAPGDLRIFEVEGQQSVSLAGPWTYSKTMEPALPAYLSTQEVSSALYNGMIAPLVNFGIAGVIWYQGENNGDRGAQYRRLFPALIQDWRIRFRQGYTPFLFVQLANCGTPTELAEPTGWPFLREAQDQALQMPLTGMAVAIDVGEARDIHPKNKAAVGERLARHALKLAYGQPAIATDGPRFRSVEFAAGQATVLFDHATGLRTRDGAAPKSFAVAGQDRVFHRAEAKIVDERLVVASAEVGDPVAVRYAWARNPLVNLENSEGLPAAPFRTDAWE